MRVQFPDLGDVMMFFIFLSGAILITPHPVHGDGMAFDWMSCLPLKQYEQRAIIRHANGIQNMLIALDLEARNAVWLFPVPGRPEAVSVDIGHSFPRLRGRTIQSSIRRTVAEWLILVPTLTQFPALFAHVVNYHLRFGAAADVIKHMEVEKFGIHAEIISAESVERLEAYLKGKGLNPSRARLASFREYLSQKYVLVVGWIAASDERGKTERKEDLQGEPGTTHNPCLLVSFPSANGYYPLKATSGYGAEKIRANLYILGFAEVQYGPLKRSTAYYLKETDTYAVHHVRGEAKLEVRKPDENHIIYVRPPEDYVGGALGDLSKRNLDYTLVMIYSRAASLTEDLQFSDKPPPAIARELHVLRVVEGTPLLILALTVFFAVVSGALTGLILYRRCRAYAILGLFTFLTLIGLVVAVYVYRTRRGEEFRVLRFAMVYTLIFHALALGAFISAPWGF